MVHYNAVVVIFCGLAKFRQELENNGVTVNFDDTKTKNYMKTIQLLEEKG